MMFYTYQYWELKTGHIQAQGEMNVEPFARGQLPAGAILHSITAQGRKPDDEIPCAACQAKRHDAPGDVVHPIFRLPALPPVIKNVDPDGPRYA